MDITVVAPDQAAVMAPELAAILVDCVAGGASVGFMAPLDPARAQHWWHGAVSAERTLTFAARDHGGPAMGVVQLKLAAFENGRHRAEVAKLLVHRDARGRGVATALLQRLEAEAWARGRWLLLLDTQTGSPAERLYERLGWRRLAVVADHAVTPDGRLAPTTFMERRLAAPEQAQ